jgi:hypothetical protein
LLEILTVNVKKRPLIDARSFLAIFVVVSVVAIIILWMLHPPTGSDAAMATLNTLVGALVGVGFAGVIQYFFGSSDTSKDKDATIAAIAMQPGAQQALPPVSVTTTTTEDSTVTKTEPAENGNKP